MSRYLRLFAVLAAFVCLMAAGIVLANSSTQIDVKPIAVEQAVEIAPQPVSTSFSYQGRLKRQGEPYSGSCAFQFELWNAADGGDQQGAMSLNAVSVTEGLFSVQLDFDDQFRGKERWLATAVQCPGDNGFTALGREPLTAVPYALGLRPGTTVENLNGSGLTGISHTEGKAGLVGLNLGEAGYGVYGSAVDGGGVVGNSINWIGVYGETDAAGGTGASGVWGRANNTGGVGVVGYAPQPDSIGVKGAANESGGVGVWGESTKNTGVYGQTSSASAAGVWGRNTAGGVAGRFDGTVKITGGADLAEQFVVTGKHVESGTLLVIDTEHPGQLKPSQQAYDTAVVGIISGANGVQPGLTLYQEGVLEGETAVAIAGRVYVLAEADSAPIQPGDLLTTSALSGHAMKASDRERAYGAVIGKALTELDSGTGLVLVVVNLQ